MSTIATFGNNWVGFGSAGSIVGAPVDPNNPLGLPEYTFRCKFSSGYTPTYYSNILVDSTENIWDIAGDAQGRPNKWPSFMRNTNLIEVIGANTTGTTTMQNKFYGCTNLQSVCLFDTSACTSFSNMFSSCTSLTSVPLFNTAGVQIFEYMLTGCTALRAIPLFSTASANKVNRMLDGCVNVESGALALYTQMSTQATPPTGHTNTFRNCGSNTASGAQELAQIPQSWGGTGA